MWEYLSSPVAQAIIWLSVALVLSITGWYFVTGWRDHNRESNSDTEVLTNFREMRQRGALDESEFRTIKSTMGDRTPKQS